MATSWVLRACVPPYMRRRVDCRGVAQPGRAPGSGPGGRRFKSSLPDQLFSSSSLNLFAFSEYISEAEVAAKHACREVMHIEDPNFVTAVKREQKTIVLLKEVLRESVHPSSSTGYAKGRGTHMVLGPPWHEVRPGPLPLDRDTIVARNLTRPCSSRSQSPAGFGLRSPPRGLRVLSVLSVF